MASNDRSGAFSPRWLLAMAVTAALLLPLVLLWLPSGQTTRDAPAVDLPLAAGPLLASFVVAAAAAILAVAIGSTFAVLFTATDLRGATLWSTLLLLAFACPPTVWSLGQMYCYGSGGLAERWLGDGWRWLYRLNGGGYLSTALVLAEIHAPLACLIVGRQVERLHHAGLESAFFYLGPARRITWLARGLRREMVSALLLAFALGAANFAVPHVLQCRLYPIEIYQRMTNYLDPHGAAQAALPLTAVTFTAALVFALGTSRGGNAPAEIHEPRLIELRHGKWLALALVGLYLAATTGLPLAALLVECKSPLYFLAAVREAFPELQNSLAIAAGAALVACLAGLICARVRGRAGIITDASAVATVGIPTLIVGLAYARFFRQAWLVDVVAIGATNWPAILGLGARAWPFATRVLGSGIGRASPQWSEAAELAQMPRLRRWSLIGAPVLARPLGAAAAIAFLIALGDVEISQMLCAPGGGTLTMRLFTFLHFGPTHVAANLALLLLMLTGLPLWLCFFLATRRFTSV